ncbi:ATP-dependent RNA helicase DDX54 [Rhodnius prolixus]|uniref:ATP-dependent RNA helicase DDX54 n=1 Tax=Rhodnius prolixus TaxID=13249 RepID=UPI003D189810
MVLAVKNEEVEGFGDASYVQPKSSQESGYKKAGGFQGMGLSYPVLKGIHKRGYKVPTPVQRKTIPLVLEGRDVVAMARTGSGKTACFLIPLFEKLKTHDSKLGSRALILSPTRELAMQTYRFVKDLGKFTALRSAVVLGGDSMESQFSTLKSNPDIIVATPGRFLHVCVEMELKLNHINYVVFDEADRLFEMGFGEQLREIVQRLPDSRQTLLFSATLPKVLVEFARAGLSDPVLIRLDVESKLPETLKLSFISCRPEEKPAALLCLLKQVIPNDKLTIIFAATKHHVEFLHALLNKCGITNSYVYSDLDPSARKINVAKFQSKVVSVLIVTDIAARGIDIPHLDYVINYNFPAKAKLFVHRVGRCARAGREGHALCLVSKDELCYLIDLHLFLGQPLKLAVSRNEDSDISSFGTIPSVVLESEMSEILSWLKDGSDLNSLHKVSENAYKQYIRSRTGASTESVKRSKDLAASVIGEHPLFNKMSKDDEAKSKLITGIHQYKPLGTIFEIGNASTSEMYHIMKTTRRKHSNSVNAFHKKLEEKLNVKREIENRPNVKLELSKPEEIGSTFSRVILGKRKNTGGNNHEILKKSKENFIPYRPTDLLTEEGLAVNNFHKDATSAGFDLTGDNEAMIKATKMRKVWDKKKRKMVSLGGEPKQNKIKSESGAWIPATFKSGRYQKWVEKTKADVNANESDEEEDEPKKMATLKQFPNTHWGKHNMKVALKKQAELKRPEQIVKAREQLEKRRRRHGRHKKSKGKQSKRK